MCCHEPLVRLSARHRKAPLNGPHAPEKKKRGCVTKEKRSSAVSGTGEKTSDLVLVLLMARASTASEVPCINRPVLPSFTGA
jgi:hypothetical protein